MRNKKKITSAKKAVVLLSGGLDSATTLYIAKSLGYACACLIFDYNQRHKREIESAKIIAQKVGCPYEILKIELPWKGSSLLDRAMDIPVASKLNKSVVTLAIPNTYVPGRNIIFLSFALSYAEAIGASAIYIGAHSQDYSGYPDCRLEFFKAFNKVISQGTKAGVENKGIEIIAPLIDKKKAEIIAIGNKLGVPFELTWSCYEGGNEPCGQCDSCRFRRTGFLEAGIEEYVSLHLNEKLEIKGKVNEVFESIQGEGPYFGKKQVFVRFSGCNLGCKFCDTKTNSFNEYSPEDIFNKIKSFPGEYHSVSFTGGEPLLQKEFLKQVLKRTRKLGLKNYLETNGTLFKELQEVIEDIDIVAMDIKLPSSTGGAIFWDEHRKFLEIASGKEVFIKAVICHSTTEEDLMQALKTIKEINISEILVLQPNSEELGEVLMRKLKAFKDICIRENVATRIIPQMHKLMGVR